MQKIRIAKLWQAKRLSVRASNCLATARITNEQQLVERFRSIACLMKLRNCGRKTANEIWNHIERSNATSQTDRTANICYSRSKDASASELESVFVPLLNIKTPTRVWKVLQSTPANSIRWEEFTRNTIKRHGMRTLADIAELSPSDWLHFPNFRKMALSGLRDRLAEKIKQLGTNPDLIDSGDVSSVDLRSVIVPLLDLTIPIDTWELLQKTPADSVRWSVRTKNVIKRQRLQTLADICRMPSSEWLKLRNFGRTSLDELQERLTEFAKHHQSKPVPLDTTDKPADLENSVFVPLLDISIPECTWNALQDTPVNGIRWSVRTKNIIRRQRLRDVSEVCRMSPVEWLTLRNFGRTSLQELQERIIEAIERQGVSLSPPDSNDQPARNQSLVFVALLDIRIPLDKWKILQDLPIGNFSWRARTRNVLIDRNIGTLAEIAALSPREWLRFRNFGRKSLSEIQQTVRSIIENPEILDPQGGRSMTDGEIRTLSDLGLLILKRLESRKQHVVTQFYGYFERRMNLEEIGLKLGISRERVRQIKKSINAKLLQGADYHIISTSIDRLLNKPIREVLEIEGRAVNVDKLIALVHQRLGWEATEPWIIDWFNDAFGVGWLCLGTDSYRVSDGVCYSASHDAVQNIVEEIATRLKRYGYTPLTSEYFEILARRANVTRIGSDNLMYRIGRHPAFKVYEYGKTFIGLKAWVWFDPEKPMTLSGRAALIEWYLRLTNRPATAKAIANGISSKLTNLRLSPFDVATICHKQPFRFQLNGKGTYGLRLWKDAAKYTNRSSTCCLTSRYL